jgi:hypothetical protein
MAKKKKWAQKVKLKEGALKSLGWPSGAAIAEAVSSGRVPYATAIRRLVYLANVNKNNATGRKARAIIVRLQKAHGKKKKKK